MFGIRNCFQVDPSAFIQIYLTEELANELRLKSYYFYVSLNNLADKYITNFCLYFILLNTACSHFNYTQT